MWFKQHTQHKTRPKLITLAISMLLVFSMVVPMIQYNTLEVYATGTDVGGQDGDFKGETTSGGVAPSWDKTAWLFYICDSNRQLLTDVVFIQGTNRMYGAGYDETYLTSRIGNQAPSRFLPPFPFGAPVKDGGSNWQKVKEDMNEHGLAYVAKVFGPEIAQKVKSDTQNVHVILETVAWGKKPGMSVGDNAVASSSGWARMAADGGCKPNSDFSWQYLNKIQKSEYLEYQWAGLDPPPTEFPSDDITSIATNLLLSNSYGMARLGTTPDAQTTCDESQNGTPSRPEDESTGVYKIVKSYRIRNLDTNVLTDKGTYVKPDSSPKISIEDESEYKLIAWKTSTTYKSDISSIKWESTVPAVHKQSGTTPTTIEMKAPETTLYLLLEKPENESTPVTGQADFVMSQSTITRKIKLSYPDNNGITIMKDTLFKWVRPAHKSSCSGHSYADGKDSEGNTKYSTAYCSYGKFTDNSVRFSLKNSEKSNYPDIVATKSGWENVTTTGLKEPLAKQAALMYNLLRKVDRTRCSDLPSV